MGTRDKLNRVVSRGLALAGVAVVAETAAQVLTMSGASPAFTLPGSIQGLFSASVGGLFPTTWAATFAMSALVMSGSALSLRRPNLGPKAQPRRPRPILRRRAPETKNERTYVRIERLLLPGERVYHPAFGTGMVASLIRNGEDLEIRVAFDGHGVERFFAANQPIGYPVIEGGLGQNSDIPDSGLRPAA